MKITYTFRGVDSSENIKLHAEEKLSKLQKYSHTPIEAEVTAYLEKHLQCIDIAVVADGAHFAGHEESEDMYASINLAIDKLVRQIRDAKAIKTTQRKHGPGLGEVAQAQEESPTLDSPQL